MANESIKIRSEAVFVHVGISPPFRLTAFPMSGTYVSIEKVANLSTFVEGQNNTAVHVLTRSDAYRVSLTIMQGTDDDAFMFAAARAYEQTPLMIPLSITYNETVYATGNAGIETIPNRELAGDNNPPLTYTLIGLFPGAIVASFGNPGQLTTEQISSFLPEG